MVVVVGEEGINTKCQSWGVVSLKTEFRHDLKKKVIKTRNHDKDKMKHSRFLHESGLHRGSVRRSGGALAL